MLAKAKEKHSRINLLDNHSLDILQINEAIEKNIDANDEDLVVPAEHHYGNIVKKMMTIMPRASLLRLNKKSRKTRE